jgi:UDP-3-O-[3-hydroxymyristoyl] glucosamine N-acyltransferase
MAAQSGVAGSTKIGASCIIGGQVGFAGHLTIHDKTSIGAQAGILGSTKKEGETLMGSPAFDYKQYLKCYALFRKLPNK